MRLSRVVVAFCILLVIAGLVLGVLSGFFTRVGREGWSALSPQPEASAARSSRLPLPEVSSAGAPSSSPVPSPSTAAQLPPSVLSVAGANQRADPSQIRALLTGVAGKDSTGVIGAAVLDGTGKSVYAVNANTALIPASTLKLLTSAAALSLFGPHHRFTTKVVARGPGDIVLVGGGDPYLQAGPVSGSQPRRATLSNLAARTAADLKAKGRRSISLGYDDSLFAGPAWNPLWPRGYRGQVGPTSALSVRPKDPNPARTAATAFASALRANRITVASVRRTKAPPAAITIAAVPSMTVQQITTQLLLVSDNDAAEVMLRQIGLKAGRGGSITGGRRAVQAELTELGVWSAAAAAYDGSGLARSSKIPPATLVKLLRLAAGPGGLKLRSLLTGLPVAGVEGTLRTRFLDTTMHPADGTVRGKTGTLTGVRSLAGYLRTRDGTVLYYAVIINGAKDDWIAGDWIERALTALSTCRCRR